MGGKLPMGNCWSDIFKKGYFRTFERSLLTSVESLGEQWKEQRQKYNLNSLYDSLFLPKLRKKSFGFMHSLKKILNIVLNACKFNICYHFTAQ